MDKEDKKKLLLELKHYYAVQLKDDPQSKFEVSQVFENLLMLLNSFE